MFSRSHPYFCPNLRDSLALMDPEEDKDLKVKRDMLAFQEEMDQMVIQEEMGMTVQKVKQDKRA